MQNLILSPIGIPDLVSLIAGEIESRLINFAKLTQPQVESQRLFGDRAAANYLGCTPLTIGKLRKSGTIPFYRYGRKYYYLSNELDEVLKVESRRFGELRNRRVVK